MTGRVLALCAIPLASLTWTGAAAAADLDDAIALYAEASYEAALEVLRTTDADDDADLVDQYRALCLLALDRQNDAEASLERIAERSPLYRIDSGAVSPRVVDLFQQVRARTLPTTARELYAAAKGQYERGEFLEARLGFVRLEKIVEEAAAIGAGDGLQDLVQLGEGFLVLIEARLAPPPVEPAPSEPSETVTEPKVLEERRIYSAGDADVVPPVPIDRSLPPWLPPNNLIGRAPLRGSLEFVVDENGTIVEAVVAEPTVPRYDRELLAATKNWRFQPATLGGTPVRYRQFLVITLTPVQ